MTHIKRNGQLLAGVILVGLGLLLALESYSSLDISGLYRLWPLVVISFGVVKLLGQTTKERSSGLFLICLGVWFLINTLRLYGLDWGESWPLLLILLGVSKLILPDDGRRSGGFLLLAIGAWAAVNVFEVWGLYWENSWSIGLIIVGLFIVWRALFESRPTSAAKEVGDD